MPLYKGEYALVTGASKGLGRAYAEALAGRGSNLVLIARSASSLECLAEQLRRNYGVTVEVIAVNLSDPSASTFIAERLNLLSIRIDLLVNNAGSGLTGVFSSHPVEDELAQIRLNISGLVALTHHFAQKMIAAGHGGIINVASNSAFQPVPYMSTYGATKAFVLMFSEAVAEEMRDTGVHVMVACPGPTATDFFASAPNAINTRLDAADFVARRTLDDFARRRVVSYPCRRGVRVSTWAARLMPRAIVVRLAADVSRKMGFVNQIKKVS